MIKYTISKHEQLGCYVLWKEKDYSSRGIFHGTKQECENKLKEVKNGKNKRTIKRSRKTTAR